MSDADPDARSGEIIALHREELVIDKNTVAGDVVRIETVTTEHEQHVEVALVHEGIDIVRVPVGRFIDRMPDIRQEGDLTIMPVVEEVLVLERRLRLKEEVHIRRVHHVEQHAETVVLRSQEAKVTRHPAGDSKTFSHSNPKGSL